MEEGQRVHVTGYGEGTITGSGLVGELMYYTIKLDAGSYLIAASSEDIEVLE